MTGQSKPANPDTFVFWKLPPLARSHVTKLMEQEDVIHLSMHSKVFKRLLKAFKIGGVTIIFSFWCKLPENDDFSEDCHTIETHYGESNDNVQLYCPHPDHRRIPGNHQQMLVHNNRMLIGRNGRKFEVNSASTFQENLATMEQITRHLLEIFYVEHFDLEYNHTKQNHIFGSFVWDIVDKFCSISVQPYNAPDRDCIFDKEEEENFDNLYGLSPEQTKFLFNEVKTDSLEFLGHISNPEEPAEIQLKHRKLEVWNTESLGWFTMDHVIDSESEELFVTFDDVKPAKTVKLLKKWQSGEKLTNLKKLELGYLAEKNYGALFKMIRKLKGVKMYSSEEAEDFMEEFDISEVEMGPFFVKRTTDGKVATLYGDDEAVHLLC